MGKISVLGKWDLENKIWLQNPNVNFHGRSFSIANYDKIINDDGKINHIIFAHGSRVEDHSKNFVDIKEKEAGIKNIIDYYKRCNDNYDIKLFLMDADAPIVEDAKYFAQYIDYLASLSTTNSINIIGLSKCGVMTFYVPRFFRNPNTFVKTNIFNIATPYEGTKLASPLIFYPEVKKVLYNKLRNEKLVNKVYNKLINIYENISSNSHMDYDIAIPGGIPDSKKQFYDENLIKNIFSGENINSIKQLNNFKNFITGIDEKTMKEAILTGNFSGIGLCILNDVFFDKQSDGMVYVSSQEKVDKMMKTKSYKLVSAHHDVGSNKRVINDVLYEVNNTIDEYNEKKIYI